MAYRFHVDQRTCINCGICMDLCPVRCLDMTRPAGEGEMATEQELLTPIPGEQARRGWMMLAPVQVAACILRTLPPSAVSELPDDEFQTASHLPPSGTITLDLRSTPRAVMPLRNILIVHPPQPAEWKEALVAGETISLKHLMHF